MKLTNQEYIELVQSRFDEVEKELNKKHTGFQRTNPKFETKLKSFKEGVNGLIKQLEAA
jgi:hypothetical protein